VRVSTLTPATIAQLDRLGAWARLSPAAAPFDAMAVWDGAGTGAVHYNAADGRGGGGGGGGGVGGALGSVARGLAATAAAALGLPRPPPAPFAAPPPPLNPATAWLGAVAENEAVSAALLAALRASPAPPEEAWACGGLAALTLPPYTRGPGAGATSPLAVLTLGDGPTARTLAARLVVGADGAGSAARRAAGLRVVEKSYGASAVVGTVSYAPGTPPASRRTAFQVFLSGGPLALLPLRGGHASVVWTLPPGEAAGLVAKGRASPAAFAAAVDGALRRGEAGPAGTWPGRATAPAPPHVVPPAGGGGAPPAPGAFPLRLRLAPRWVRPRFALLGDAAHAVHPLAGQGVNLGFGDAASLGEALARAVAAGGDVGATAPTLGAHYQGTRRPATATWVAALDGLATAFSGSPASQTGIAAALRGAGLRVVSAVGPARAAIVRFASGV